MARKVSFARSGGARRSIRRNMALAAAVLAGAVFAPAFAQATNLYWDSNSTTAGAGAAPMGTWGTSSFWNTDSAGIANSFTATTAATNDLYLVAGPSATSGENAYTVTVSGTQSADGLFFQASGATTISGGTAINLYADGIYMPQYAYGTTAQGAVTISTAITLEASQSWINNSNSLLTISGATSFGSSGTLALTFDGTGKTVVSNAFTGTTPQYTKNGTGELIFTFANAATFNSTMTLDNGVFSVTGGNNIPVNLVFNGGMLRVANGVTASNYSIPQTYTVTSGGATIEVQNSDNFTFSSGGSTTGTFTGGTALAPVTVFKTGTGTFNWSNNAIVTNSLNANMGVYGGIFQFDSGTSMHTSSAAMYSADILGGVLYYSSAAELAGGFSATVSSSGSSIGAIYQVNSGQNINSLVGTGSAGGAVVLYNSSTTALSAPNMTTLGNGLMWLGGNQVLTALTPDSDATYRLLGNTIGAAGVLSGSNNVIVGAGPNMFNSNPILTNNPGTNKSGTVQIEYAQTFSGTLTVQGSYLTNTGLSSGQTIAEVMNSGTTMGSILNVPTINVGPNATLQIYNNGVAGTTTSLNSSATMNLTDGRLILQPNNNALSGMSETLAALNVSGLSSIDFAAPSSALSDQLTVGNLVINPGGFLTINTPNSSNGSLLGTNNGTLFVTNLNGSPIATGFVSPAIRWGSQEFGTGTMSWVTYSATQGFQLLTSYTANPTFAQFGSAVNADFTTGTATTMTGSGSLQTIRFTGAATLNIGTGNTLTVTSGGIACNGSNGTFDSSTSTAGILTIPSNVSSLYFNAGGNTIKVYSQLSGNFNVVMTNGSGVVTLYNTANNFVGNVYIEVWGNTLTPPADSVFGNANNQIFVNSAVFTNGSGAWTTSRTFNVMPGGVTFNVNNTTSIITLNGQVTGSGPITVGQKNNTQILVLGNPTPNSNNFTGTVYMPDGPENNTIAPTTIRTAAAYVLGNNAAYVTGGSTLIDLTNNGATPAGFSQSMGSLEGSGNINLGTSAVLTVGGSNNASGVFEGVMTGNGGGLTKAGAGTLSLSANQAYTGPTTIAGGTLRLLTTGAAYNSSQMHGNIAPSSSITVGDSLADNTAVLDVSAFNTTGTAFTVGATTAQTLSGFGTIKGSTIIGALATVAPGSAGNTGTLSIAGNATLIAGAILNYNFNTPGDSTGSGAISSSLAVTGSLNLTANGLTNDVLNITMVGNPTLTPGSYRVATASAGITNNVNGWTISGTPAGYNSSVTVSGNYLLLNFTAALAPITWTGSSGPLNAATWDFATTNWTPTAGGGAVLYQDTAPVTFDDSGTNTAGIVIAAAGVQPLSVLFANTAQAYSFAAGGGPIAGSAGVTVSGGGKVTFNNANTYAGGTAISNASTVVVGNSSALGAAGRIVSITGGGVLDLATGASVNAYSMFVSGTATISSDAPASGSPGTAYTLGTLSIGASQLNIAGGSNVTSGTAGVAFGATTLSGAPTFNITNPAGGGTTLLTLGAVNMSGGANTITLTGNGNVALAGAVTNGSGGLTLDSNFTGSASLSASNSYTGPTSIQNGKLVLGLPTSLPTGTLVSFGSATTAGTLDLAGMSPHVGGLISVTSSATQVIGNSSTSNASTMTISGTTANTFAGTIQDTLPSGNKTVALILTAGTQTLSGSNNYSGGTTLTGGHLNAASVNAFGNGSLQLNGGTLGLATDTTVNPYNTTIGGSPVTIVSDRATSGGGITQTLGTLSIGADQLNVTAGASATSGSPAVAFGAVTLTGNAILNPTTASLNLGSVNGGGYSLTAQGSAGANTIAAITNVTGLTLSGGTWALSGSNTFTGTTTVSGGKVNVGGTLASTSINVAAGTLALSNAAAVSGGTQTIALSGTGTLTESVANAISGGASLTMGAGGTLTLTQPNDYSGTTSVNAGTLLVNAPLPNTFAVNVASTATLGGNSSIGGPVTVNGGTLSPHGSGSGTADLIVSNTFTLNTSSTLNFNFAAPGISDMVTGITNLTLLGTSTLNISGQSGFGVGTYELFGYTGSLTNGAPNISIGATPSPIYTYTVLDPANGGATGEITVQVALKPTLTWTAGANTTWSTASDLDWNNGSGSAAYTQVSPVLLNDNVGPASQMVTLSGALTPLSVTVTTNNTYVFTGSGSIGDYAAGAAYLVKNGSGTLVMNATTANSYSGGTTINGGTIAVSTAGGLGATSSPLTINNGTLEVTANVSSSRSISLGDTNAAISVDRGQIYASSGTISGTGNLNAIGTGTLALSGTNNFTGQTMIQSGTVSVAALNAAGNTQPLGANPNPVVIGSAITQYSTTNATLAYTGAATSSNIPITINSGGGAITSTNALTLTGTISGGLLTVKGPGKVTLQGTNTYSGGTNIAGGSVVVGGGTTPGSLGSGTVTLSAGGSLEFSGPVAAAIAALYNSPTSLASPTGTSGGATPNTLALSNWTADSAELITSSDPAASQTITLNGATGRYVAIYSTARASSTYGLHINASGVTVANAGGNVALPTAAASYVASSSWGGTPQEIGPAGGGAWQAGANGGISGGTNVGPGPNWGIAQPDFIFFDLGAAYQLTSMTINWNQTNCGSDDLIILTANVPASVYTLSSLASSETSTSVILDYAQTINVGSDNSSTTFAGVISGGGALVKAGTGTMTLSNANTYSGGTTISNGGLVLTNTTGSGTGTGPVTVAATGLLGGNGSSNAGANVVSISGTVSPHVGSGSDTATLNVTTTAGVTFSNGTNLNFNFGNSAPAGAGLSDLLNITGALTLSLTGTNAATVTFNQLDSSTYNLGDSYTLLTASGGITGFSAASWAVAGSLPAGMSGVVTESGNRLLLTFVNPSLTWFGQTSNTWDASTTNWKLSSDLATGSMYAPPVVVTFDDHGAAQPNVVVAAAGVSPTGVYFSNSAVTYTVSGGAIGGSAFVAVTGGGTVNLNSPNTYTGGTTVTNGSTLNLGDPGAAGPAGAAVSLSADATIAFRTNSSVNAYTVSVGGNGTIVSDLAAPGAGITHTLGALTNLGPSTLNINGGNNVTTGTAGVAIAGTTTLSSPLTFNITNPAAAAATTLLTLGAVNNGANSITLTGNGQFAQSAAIGNGSGGVAIGPGFTGTAALSQTNLYTGGTALAGGTLNINKDAALGATSGALAFTGNATLQAATSLALSTSRTVSIGTGVTATIDTNGYAMSVGAISGAGNLAKIGANTLTLVAASSYTGTTLISGGTFALGLSNVLPAATPVQIALGATLDLNGVSQTVDSLSNSGGSGGVVTTSAPGLAVLTLNTTTATTFGGTIQDGAGQLGITVSGIGTQSLTSPNSYTGPTTISGGTLSLEVAGAISASPVTVSGTGTLATTVANALSGSASLTISGAGASATLSNANNYTGGTTVSGGTLILAADGAIGSGSLTLAGTLQAAGSPRTIATATTVTGDSTLSGNQSIAFTGAVTISSGKTLHSATTGTVDFSGAASFANNGTLDAVSGVTTFGTNPVSGKLSVETGGALTAGFIPSSTALTMSGAAVLNLGGTATPTTSTIAGTGIMVSTGAPSINLGNNAGVQVSAITVASGATLMFNSTSPTTHLLIVTGGLAAITGGGNVDVTNNDMILQSGTTEEDLRSSLSTSYALGSWNGSGLVTSAGLGNSTGIGYLTQAEFAAFHGAGTIDGYTPVAGDLIAKYTYLGDITLSGLVTPADYRLMDAGYLQGFDYDTNSMTGTAGHWINGDVNYDGVVNALDYALADASAFAEGDTVLGNQMYQLHAAEFGQTYISAFNAAVPEPASLMLLGLGAAGLLLRRRK